jgi:hypothetical protein
MSLDDGQTHYVGDGCQPAHDPAIDQAMSDSTAVPIDAPSDELGMTDKTVLSEDEYLGIVDHAQRAIAGDQKAAYTVVNFDMIHMLAAYRDHERQIEQLRAAVMSEPEALVALISDREDLREWSAQLIAAIERRNDTIERLRFIAETANRAYLAFCNATSTDDMIATMAALSAALDALDDAKATS